jgi:hypothetical protein
MSLPRFYSFILDGIVLGQMSLYSILQWCLSSTEDDLASKISSVTIYVIKSTSKQTHKEQYSLPYPRYTQRMKVTS